MKWYTPALAAAVLMTIVAIDVRAESLRCKGDLVKMGDSKADVLAKCGEPVSKDSRCKPGEQQQASVSGGTIVNVLPCEKIDEWSYNPGSGQFITTLRFEGGELRSMKYGARVP